MRPWSLAFLFVMCAGCAVPVPVPRALAKVSVTASVHAEAEVKAPVPVRGSAVVEFFGIPLEGAQDIIFVLDRSGSMSADAEGAIAHLDPAPAPGPESAPPEPPKKIAVAQDELVDALRRLEPGTRMNVVFFNYNVTAFGKAMVPLDEPARDHLITFVQETTPSGNTALSVAMRTAFMMNPRRVVLLSDGLGNVDGGARAVLRDAREALRGGVRIDTIGIGKDQDAELLETLARESGGIYQAF